MNDTYTLIGSDGSTIIFDDIQYSVLREGLEGLSTYPAEYETVQTPGVVGGRVINTVFEARELSLQVLIYGEGRAELETRRRALVKALNPLLGHCKLCWHQESGATYYLEARPTEESPMFDTGTSHTARFWQCTVGLVCADPCWHSNEESAQSIISENTGFHLPFQVPFSLGTLSPYIMVTNNGTAPAPATIVLNGEMTAPIVLTNTTSGETISIKRNILSGDTLTINTDRNDLKVTYYDHTTGTTSNALSYCTVGSKFWQLAVGTNDLDISIYDVGDDASAFIRYRERMVAI